jgi:two-component system nitrogen regulation sensor histidine kinase NtrY
VNVVPAPQALKPGRPARSGGLPPGRGGRLRRLADLLLGKGITLVLAAVALVLGIASFVLLASAVPTPNQAYGMVLANLVVLLLLGALLAGRLTRMWMERRRGSAGARLHVRLVLLFSVVAITPAIVVAVFSTIFFDLGIKTWFNDPIRAALQESVYVARGYLAEHRNDIRADALQMAADLSRAGGLLAAEPDSFAQILAMQTALRGLTDAVIFEPVTTEVVASYGLMQGNVIERPPAAAIATAEAGDVAVLGSPDSTRVRAVVQMDTIPKLMLQISRPVDPEIIDHMRRAEVAAAQYERLDQNRTGLQVTFALIFALVALLVLAAAVLIGLVLANQIARPVGRLITAAERVRAGDLSVRVPEVASGDELAGLSRAFNRMTGQLGAQRSELMDAYSQIDERRRFTEAVLSGVTAGVIGLDPQGRIELPNRAASILLGVDLLARIGQPLVDAVPEFAGLLQAARDGPAREGPEWPNTAEMQIGPAAARRTLLVRIVAERTGLDRNGADHNAAEDPDEQTPAVRSFGFVATFDDITALQSAQRKAAWSDVARRIAHEIKNPLTPIQLAAERLKRRFSSEITSDPDTFIQCADTIVRHVGDIGRMVDEFSAFARMPHLVVRPEDIGRIARETLVLQRNAHPEISWTTDIPERGPLAPCDRRQLGQALTNLLRNAADAVTMRCKDAQARGKDMSGEELPPSDGHAGATAEGRAGRIDISVRAEADSIVIRVADDGIGLPVQDRLRLTEPYVTHKPKGTGLGLAIVKKIMEDHGGQIQLEDRMPSTDWQGGGSVAILVLPSKPPDEA